MSKYGNVHCPGHGTHKRHVGKRYIPARSWRLYLRLNDVFLRLELGNLAKGGKK